MQENIKSGVPSRKPFKCQQRSGTIYNMKKTQWAIEEM